MDRTIEKKGWSVSRWGITAGLGILAAVVAWQLVSRTGTSRLSVDPSRLTTAQVRSGVFLDYYPFDGTVQPATSVYLDVEEGGRVEQIVDDGGQHVEKGDLILRFSNAALERSTIQTEGTLLYNLDIQRGTQHDRAQNVNLLKETLLDPRPPDSRRAEQGPALRSADQERRLCGDLAGGFRDTAQPDSVSAGQARPHGREDPAGGCRQRPRNRRGAEGDRFRAAEPQNARRDQEKPGSPGTDLR